MVSVTRRCSEGMEFGISNERKEANAEVENIFNCYRCENCDFETYSVVVLTAHNSNCNNASKKRETTRAVNQSRRRDNIKYHILSKHTDPTAIKRLKCVQCVYKTKTKNELRAHIATKHVNPEDIKWLECAQCDFKTRQKRHLKRHVLRQHGNPEDIRWFECEQCAFKSKQKCHLKRHVLLIHSPEDLRWFECAQWWYLAMCECRGASGPNSLSQSLDELEFERGLWCAAQYGDMERALRLLNGGFEVDRRDAAGYTALHYAARNGHLDVCRLLLDRGASVDVVTPQGQATPLHRAATVGKLDVVECLVKNRANVNLKDSDGRTALHRAAINQHFDVCKYLLVVCPQSKDEVDMHNKTPMDYVQTDQTSQFEKVLC